MVCSLISTTIPIATPSHEVHHTMFSGFDRSANLPNSINNINLGTKRATDDFLQNFNELKANADAGAKRWKAMLGDEGELHDVCSQLKYKKKDLDYLNLACDKAQKHLMRSMKIQTKGKAATSAISLSDAFQACAKAGDDPMKAKTGLCTTLGDVLVCKYLKDHVVPKLKIDDAFRPGGPCFAGEDAQYNTAAADSELMAREVGKLMQNGVYDVLWFAIAAPWITRREHVGRTFL
eukprot:GEMP01045789.1.p1 GENE.GEMP01045789.1~~GEMP01045789.1.p1  ORF type:complete len:235 (+),score=54.64 GEMP01045789.1:85-789(+)